jgi:hypothetical protein
MGQAVSLHSFAESVDVLRVANEKLRTVQYMHLCHTARGRKQSFQKNRTFEQMVAAYDYEHYRHDEHALREEEQRLEDVSIPSMQRAIRAEIATLPKSSQGVWAEWLTTVGHDVAAELQEWKRANDKGAAAMV